MYSMHGLLGVARGVLLDAALGKGPAAMEPSRSLNEHLAGRIALRNPSSPPLTSHSGHMARPHASRPNSSTCSKRSRSRAVTEKRARDGATQAELRAVERQ